VPQQGIYLLFVGRITSYRQKHRIGSQWLKDIKQKRRERPLCTNNLLDRIDGFLPSYLDSSNSSSHLQQSTTSTKMSNSTTGTNPDGKSNNGLSRGDIAGIVVGCVFGGVATLLAILQLLVALNIIEPRTRNKIAGGSAGALLVCGVVVIIVVEIVNPDDDHSRYRYRYRPIDY
jgi:hypothetical protein